MKIKISIKNINNRNIHSKMRKNTYFNYIQYRSSGSGGDYSNNSHQKRIKT